jgi:phage terminase small subunit
MDKVKRGPGRPRLQVVPSIPRMQPKIEAKVRASLSDHDASSLRRSGAVSDTSNPGTEQPVAATSSGRKTKQKSAPIPHLGVTAKQEAFCQAVSSGKNLSDAYRSAYVTDNMAESTIHELSCRLFSDSKVRARMLSISQELEANRRMMASSDAALALRVLRQMAEKADTDAAKIRAAELLAKVGGLFVEQVDISDKRERSEDELEAAIKQRLSRLGLAS